MDAQLDRQGTRVGGICGIAGIVCYISATVISLPPLWTFLLAVLWPILSIVYAYTLYRAIAVERNGAFNILGFIFAIVGFTIVAQMLAIQLAVQIGFVDIKSGLSSDLIAALTSAHRLTRMVDMGLDVAWDVFIGTALILSGAAMYTHSHFGKIWSGLSVVLGLALIVLNVSTFPYPPADRGLFDIGPLIGVFVVSVSIRLLILARATDQSSTVESQGSAE